LLRKSVFSHHTPLEARIDKKGYAMELGINNDTPQGRTPRESNSPILDARSEYQTLKLKVGEIEGLNDLADNVGAPFVRLPESQELDLFLASNRGKIKWRETLTRFVAEARDGTNDASTRYDFEYGTWNYPRFRAAALQSSVSADLEGSYRDECNYAFSAPILSLTGFLRIVGEDSLEGEGLVVDVACGNRQLIDFLQKDLGVDRKLLRGIDISPAAVALLRQDGIEGFTGDLQAATKNRSPAPWLAAESTRLLFLSYFVDRDADQQGTFDASVSALCAGGRIVLEGLFPAKLTDSLGTMYASQQSRMVTVGDSATDDVKRVVEYFQSKGVTLERIAVGERLVYSLDGFELLPSLYLVLQKGGLR
jgi:hypothetical protein